MIRLLTFLSFAALAAVALPSQAATVLVTFDESGISVGNHITEQYQAFGLHFSAATQNTVTTGAAQNNPFVSDGQLIQFSVNPVDAFLSIDSLASTLSLQHRRPAQNQSITITLLNGANQVFQSTVTSSGSQFSTFSYAGQQGLFNKVRFEATQKFFVDNIVVTSVPVPAAALLFAGSLPLLAARRRRKA